MKDGDRFLRNLAERMALVDKLTRLALWRDAMRKAKAEVVANTIEYKPDREQWQYLVDRMIRDGGERC